MQFSLLDYTDTLRRIDASSLSVTQCFSIYALPTFAALMATPEYDAGTRLMSPVSIDGDNISTRRSSRAKKAPAKYDEEYVIPAHKAPIQFAIKQTRPKRKAAEAATQSIIQEETGPLLDYILSRMSPDERKEYGGWVELESEPGFFNAMLQELGAKDFKVQEVYSLDEDTLGLLPKPAYGLIFLFQYEGDDEPTEDDNRQDCPDHLWFANQTTANACATVALVNIIMNAHNVGLGTQLQKFKNSTKGLSPPHRGHFLDTNDFIRSIHNSVASRRIDLVAEDLALDNKHEESLKKRKTQKKSARSSRKKASTETNYHYIAYVPANGQVWELDGFQTKPLCLGPAAESWLDTASTAIQERMMRNADFSSYSLLSICQSPLKTLSGDLAISLACSRALDELFSGNPTWSIPDPFKTFIDARLTQRNLSRKGIADLELPAPFTAKMGQVDFGPAEALEIAGELKTEQDSLDAQYVVELATIDEAVEMVRGRQRDYTPAIHQWVRALAEKGVLRELIQEMNRDD
ncbi:cysteine proteinase [Hypoxylon crocopeplum]|nr:cysteine proteinase [Hypoxylon crocopeplum]